MKVLPFILFFIHLQYVICEFEHSSDFVTKKLPKKNLQILISRKLLKPKLGLLKPKKPSPSNKDYTAFPAIGSSEKRFYAVPESPYFPLDQAHEQKARVKKVLPDYLIGAVRRKRSAEPKPVEQKQVDKPTTKAVARIDNSNTTKKLEKSRLAKKTKRSGLSRNGTLTKTRSKKRNGQSKSLRVSGGLKVANRTRKRSRSNKTRLRRRNVRKGADRKKGKKAESRRLIAARDALIEDYPYVVSIQKNREHWCAGALLNPTLVITTANCLWKANRISRMKIRAGSRHVDYGGQEARIQEVIKHPSWSIRRNPDNDVALILLDRRIKFSDSVHGVDLPNRIMLPAFEDAWITSWGAERRDGVYDKSDMSLQVFHARLMDRNKCNNVTQRFGITVSENFICLSQSGRRAPCTRDTGAPAVSDGVLWGLASWGIRKLCGTERFPAMFSYLASQTNMDFILNATRYLMSDERHYPHPDRFPTLRAQPVTLQTRPEVKFR